MLLDLREIIGVPGGILRFDYAPELSEAAFGSVTAVSESASAVGNVKNAAGALTFTAAVDAAFTCVCSRCLKEFELPVHRQISVHLTEDEEAGDAPGMFFISGDRLDADEVIVTDFILNAEQSLLCKDDCRGLCEKCGSDLNAGVCACETETDPRLAVLEQLLEDY
ncbi:MAG: DUF177 domain-containing protein [Oscillospiraceae bacterium]|jgi:uncharacterized protein|nr:DUF177 domain-containing protein [Oscillospiraceae bacterium]